MSNLVTGGAAPTFDDSPSVLGLETIINALLAPLLSNQITGVAFTSEDQVRNIGTELRVIISYNTAGTVITNPYLIKGFLGATVDSLVTQINAFMVANPGYFFSPVYLSELISPRRSKQVLALLVYNTSLADGTANWASGGGGGGGGTLAGDVSGPLLTNILFAGELTAAPAAVLTVLDSVSAAAYKTVFWAFEAIKGVNTYSSQINASHDGTTAVWVEALPVLAPGIGTFDFVNTVDVSGGLLRLLTTPASGGWSFRIRQLTLLTS